MMTFSETELPGVWLIEPVVHEDSRGFFMESFTEKEMESHGLPVRFVQDNHARSRVAGVLRGLHFQKPPPPRANWFGLFAAKYTTWWSTCVRPPPPAANGWPLPSARPTEECCSFQKDSPTGIAPCLRIRSFFTKWTITTHRSTTPGFAGTTRGWGFRGPIPARWYRPRTPRSLFLKISDPRSEPRFNQALTARAALQTR